MLPLVLMLILQTPAASEDPYQIAKELYRNGESETAILLLENAIAKGNQKPERLFYGLGWIHFKERNLDDAHHYLRYVVLGEPAPVIKANCHYMMGLIESKLEKPGGLHQQEAPISEQVEDPVMWHFKIARNLFRELDHDSGEFRTLLAMAAAEIEQGEVGSAETILAEIYSKSRDLDENLAYFYSLKSLLEFQKRNYRGAQNFAEMMLMETKRGEIQVQIHNAYIDVAFYSCLVHDYERAKGAIEQANYPNAPAIHFARIAVVMMMLESCTNISYPQRVDLLPFLDRDKQLRQSYEFAKNWSCGD